jgi:hypothetical protein
MMAFLQDLFIAGAGAALGRFVRLRQKARKKEEDRVQILIPEWQKFLIYWVLMFFWIKLFVGFLLLLAS